MKLEFILLHMSRKITFTAKKVANNIKKNHAQPSKTRAPRPTGRRCSHPAFPHLQRLSGKRRQANKGCLCPGEVTCAVPGAQPGSPQPRLGPRAWITASPGAGAADQNWDTTRHLRPSPWRMGFGRNVRPRKGRAGSQAGPGTHGGSPTSVPWSGSRLWPVTHFDTLAGTKATAAAQPEGLRTSWASSTALRHASGPSWGTRPGTSVRKERGLAGRPTFLRAPGAPQRLSPARKRRSPGWGKGVENGRGHAPY